MPDVASYTYTSLAPTVPTAPDHPEAVDMHHHMGEASAVKDAFSKERTAAADELLYHAVAPDDGMAESKHPLDASAQAAVEEGAVGVQSTQELWNAATQLDAYDKLALEAAAELRRGDRLHGRGIVWPANSVAHEAYGVLLEEVDELWEEVKKRQFSRAAARKEALQVAAMALRFVANVCDYEPEPVDNSNSD